MIALGASGARRARAFEHDRPGSPPLARAVARPASAPILVALDEEGAKSDRDPPHPLVVAREQQDGAVVDDDLHGALVVLDA